MKTIMTIRNRKCQIKLSINLHEDNNCVERRGLHGWRERERESVREQWKTHWSPIVRARTQICPLMPEQAISSIRSVRRGQRAGEQSAAATMKVDAEAKAAAATHNEIIYNMKTTAAATTT